MESVVSYNRRGAIANASIGFGGGGGDVDDILRRLSNVESGVSELRSQVRGLLEVVPHFATKADVAILPYLATKADVADVRTEITQVKGDLASMEAAIIKWIIATVLTSTALAFTIAKFVH